MATSALTADQKIKAMDIRMIEPEPGGVNLISGMLFLVVVASVWASVVVGSHFLELYVFGAH